MVKFINVRVGTRVPGAPTNLTVPADVDAGVPMFATWTYKSEGSGAQVSYQMRWKLQADSFWTTGPIVIDSRPTGIIANMVANPSVESSTSGWESNTGGGVTFNSANFVRATTRSSDGSYALETTLPGNASWVNTWVEGLIPDRQYNIGCDVWVPTGTADPACTVLGAATGSPMPTKNAWARCEMDFTATDTTYAVGPSVAQSNNGDMLWVDNMSVIEVLTAGTYELQVRTAGVNGFGPWSDTATFTIGGVQAFADILGLRDPYQLLLETIGTGNDFVTPTDATRLTDTRIFARTSVRNDITGLRDVVTVAAGGGTTPSPSDFLVITASELAALPTTGAAYNNMKAAADATWPAVAFTNQDNDTAGYVVAGALVYARTGNATYKTKVDNVLAQVPSATLVGTRVLAVARQVAGYVIAASLTGYNTVAFRNWVDTIRTYNIGGHARWPTILRCSWNSTNNWGAHALMSRVACSLFLDDLPDIADCVNLFRSALGERSLWTQGAVGDSTWPLSNGYFEPTQDFDPTWACPDVANWTGVGGACAGKDGAVTEDIARSAGSFPTVDATGKMYSWETIGAWMLTARMLKYGGGYTGVYGWSNSALRRTGLFMEDIAGYPPQYGDSYWVPWALNKAYGTTFPTVAAGSVPVARCWGYTDWLN